MGNNINWEEWGFTIPEHNEERYKVLSKANDFSENFTKNPYTYFSKPIKGNLYTRKSYSVYSKMCYFCFSPTISEDERMTMCDEWLDYCAFEEWWNKNYYEVEGVEIVLAPCVYNRNNKNYAPNTCCFLPRGICGCFKKDRNKARNGINLPSGINVKEGRSGYLISMAIENERINVGVADTLEEAILVRDIFQTQKIHYLASKYKEMLPEKVYDFMKNMEVSYWT